MRTGTGEIAPAWAWWTDDDDQHLVIEMPHPAGTVVERHTVLEYGHTVRVELALWQGRRPVRPAVREEAVTSTLRTTLHQPVGGREVVVFANGAQRATTRLPGAPGRVFRDEPQDGAARTEADPSLSDSAESGRVPRYYRAKTLLLDLIRELGQGAPLPPERELSARFGIARMTLRQAVSELVVEGKVRRKQGSGTFVAPPKLVQRMGTLARDIGTSEANPLLGRRLVRAEQFAADAVLAGELGLEPGDPVVHVERLMSVDDEPMSLESSYLSATRFPELIAAFDGEGPLLDCLRDRYRTVPTCTEEQVETVLASPREARLLGTNPAAPMLLLHRISRDARGNPVERSRALYRGDRFTFAVRLDTTA